MRRALPLSAVPRTQPGKQAFPQEFCVRAGGPLREAQRMSRRGGTRDAPGAMWRHADACLRRHSAREDRETGPLTLDRILRRIRGLACE